MAYKVLIVDDSRLARMSVARALTTLQPDWTRIEASTADDALARLDEEGADIALLDFNMPGRDGLELAAELRARDPDMPMALISANSQHEIVARAHHVGAAFLTKPLTNQALADFFSGAQIQLKTAGR